MNLRTFKLSCKYFSGFTCDIDLDNHDNIDSVINEVKSKLRCVLKENNLSILLQYLDFTNYHIHDYTFADTLVNIQPFYLCSHCEYIFKLEI